MGVRPDSGLLAALMALLVAAIIGANSREERAELSLVLEGEVTLLATDGEQEGAETDAPNNGLNKAALDEPNAYFKIPHFNFEHMSTEELVPSRMACQAICNSNVKCRSFSFREPRKSDKEADADAPVEDKEEKAEGLNQPSKNPPKPMGTCKWSTEALHYLLGWKFYTKAKDIDWQGRPHLTTENFHEFPGLEYQDPNFKQQTNIPLSQCKVDCARDSTCGAFSYNEGKLFCRLAGRGLNYDKDFTYYEKPADVETNGDQNNADEDDSARNMRILKSQEKAAKNAATTAAAAEKAKRQVVQESFGKKHASQSIAKETAHKKSAGTHAEAVLLAQKKKMQNVEDTLKIQDAFQKGFFMARGMNQEKKVKEVALKKMVLKHEAEMAAHESRQKTGEFQVKKKEKERHQEMTSREMVVSQTKEKLLKVGNAQQELLLKEEEETYMHLARDEDMSIHKIEARHQQKVEKLRQWTDRAHYAIKTEQQEIAELEKKQSRATQKEDDEIEKATEQHESKVKGLRADTEMEVKKIIEKAVPNSDEDDDGNDVLR